MFLGVKFSAENGAGVNKMTNITYAAGVIMANIMVASTGNFNQSHTWR